MNWMVVAVLVVCIIFGCIIAVIQASSGKVKKAILSFLLSVISGTIAGLLVHATVNPPSTEPTQSEPPYSTISWTTTYPSQSQSYVWGPWSPWSTDKVEESETREVSEETWHRYKYIDITTSLEPNLPEWTLEKTEVVPSDQYGPWSDWSPDYGNIQEDDNTDVDEPKTQYSYCEVYRVAIDSDWSQYSNWQDGQIDEDYYTDVDQRTVYAYYYFQCPNCGAHMHGWSITCPTWAGGCGKATIPEASWHVLWSTTPHNDANFRDWHGTGYRYAYIDGELVFEWSDGMNSGEATKTQYRCRTRSKETETVEGEWSAWSDTPYYESDSIKVKTQVVYRYRLRSSTIIYHYSRESWTEWNNIEQKDDRYIEHEEKTFYRYRDRQ